MGSWRWVGSWPLHWTCICSCNIKLFFGRFGIVVIVFFIAVLVCLWARFFRDVKLFLSEFHTTNFRLSTARVGRFVRWILPIPTTFKLYTDAALDSLRYIMGLGAVVSDHHGVVLLLGVDFINNCVVKFVHSFRSANRVAHFLAKLSLVEDKHLVWWKIFHLVMRASLLRTLVSIYNVFLFCMLFFFLQKKKLHCQ
ncbi:hypothetical protein ACOSQ4_006306 [Xanthoceras sorbifolium]